MLDAPKRSNDGLGQVDEVLVIGYGEPSAGSAPWWRPGVAITKR